MPDKIERDDELNEAMLGFAFEQIHGRLPSTDTFHLIARSCVLNACMWVDGIAQVMLDIVDDEALVNIIAGMARQELKFMRANGVGLAFLPSKEPKPS